MLMIRTNTHKYQYELSNIARLFFDAHQIVDAEEPVASYTAVVELMLTEAVGLMGFSVDVLKNHKEVYHEAKDMTYDEADEHSKRQFKRAVLKAFYKGLQILDPKETPWGILTGVRPVKLVHEYLDQGLTEEEIMSHLVEELCLDEDKAHLVIRVARTERRLIFPVDPKSFSLYVGIPFCPSRCHYCSFPSHSSKDVLLLQSYVDTLIRELAGVLPFVDKEKADSLYFGGGTPSVLAPEQTRLILETIGSVIPLDSFKEITFEAGRPETITAELLEVLRTYGIDRICLNPQTFKNETLISVGRTHNKADILEAYQLIRAYGFNVVNMDLIAGLPAETFEDWCKTLDAVLVLRPENITVHTLALKSGAELKASGYVTPEHLVTEMIEYAQDHLHAEGFAPYYLYRQKYIAGNLENVGYSRKGFESRYNMEIMEERQSIYAFGVGAVSKMTQDNDRFERVANPRDIKLYVQTVDEIIDKKRRFLAAN